jgi:hypothetical protein
VVATAPAGVAVVGRLSLLVGGLLRRERSRDVLERALLRIDAEDELPAL